MDKGRQFDIPRRRNASASCIARRGGTASDRGRLHQFQEGADPSQKYSPYELGFGKMVHLDKETSSASARWPKTNKDGVTAAVGGLEVDGWKWKSSSTSSDISPAAPSQASRVAVPIYAGEKHVGKATTTAFSPLLKS